MDKLYRRAAAIAALAAALSLGACARPVGDFGRAEADPLHNQVMPAIGTARAELAREPVSAFNLADQEREMRDRIWHYLVSRHAFDWFGDSITELQRTRVLPMSARSARVERYYTWLHGTDFASSRVRYARVSDDVTTDIGLLPDVFVSICAVQQLDRQRGIAANGMPGLDDRTRANAAARQAENETQIGWFTAALGLRYEAYSYALDHLLVETPHEEAVGTNALLSELDVYVEAAQRGDFCSGALPGRAGHAERPLRSRYLHSELVPKGS